MWRDGNPSHGVSAVYRGSFDGYQRTAAPILEFDYHKQFAGKGFPTLKAPLRHCFDTYLPNMNKLRRTAEFT